MVNRSSSEEINRVRSINRLISLSEGMLGNGYNSIDTKKYIIENAQRIKDSDEAADIVLDVFGMRDTDKSDYFSVEKATEFQRASIKIISTLMRFNSTSHIQRLITIRDVLGGMENSGEISSTTYKIQLRLREIDTVENLVLMELNKLGPEVFNISQVAQDVISNLQKSNMIQSNTVRLLRRIYRINKRTQHKNNEPSVASQKTILKEIKLGNFSIVEAFLFESSKLSELYIKNFELESEELDKDKIRKLIEELEGRRIRAKKLLRKAWRDKKYRLIFSGDFKLDAFLEVNDTTEPVLPNGNRRYIKMYDLYEAYGEQTNDELLDYAKQFNGTDVKRVVYRVNIGDRMTFVSLDEKYKRTINRLKEMLTSRDDAKQSALINDGPKIKVQYLSDLEVDLDTRLDEKGLHENLYMFGSSYFTKLLSVYREHFIEMTSLKIEPNEVLILDDFKLKAYIKSPYGDIIKIFRANGASNKCVFTPEFKEYIRGKSCDNIGLVVYRIEDKDSVQYVEAEQRYAIAIDRIREVLNQESTKSTTSDPSSNSIIKLYSLYGIVPDFIEPSYEQFKCWAGQYGERFMQKLKGAYQTELGKLPASTFDDFVNVNVLLSPFALEGYIQYHYSVVRGRTDNCRGAEWTTQTRYIKLVSNANTVAGVKPKLSEEAIKALTNWKKLKNPRILFKTADECDEKALVDVREKYRRGIERIEHILKTYNK